MSSVMILGIAGGNGRGNIDREKYSAVYGVDINPDYLREAKKRHPGLEGVLKLMCVDLVSESHLLPRAELVIADLLIEYIGCECFGKVVLQTGAEYVSCGIQINTESGFVSESPYQHAFDGLGEVHRDISPEELAAQMSGIGYAMTGSREYPLPNGKKILRIDFKAI